MKAGCARPPILWSLRNPRVLYPIRRQTNTAFRLQDKLKTNNMPENSISFCSVPYNVTLGSSTGLVMERVAARGNLGVDPRIEHIKYSS